MTKPDTKPEPKPYTGPAKPIPTHREFKELITDKAERVIFLLFGVIFALMLLLEVI
ncbi:hypothetical protein K0U83_26510 [bacterium]|nr:hypothetical protein [bacterium]